MTEPRDPFEEWLDGGPVEPLAPHPGAFERVAGRARRRRTARAVGVAASVLVLLTAVTGVVTALAGRGGDLDTPATPPAVTSAAPTTESATPTRRPPSTAPATPPATTPSTTPGVTRCHTSDLQVSVGPGDSAAGHVGLRIVFTNKLSRACEMFGYPGVSFLSGPAGSEINLPATRSAAEGAPKLIALAAGGRAHADLLLVNTANFATDTCKPVQAAGVRVYPPDETASAFAVYPVLVCSANGVGTAQVFPVQSGG
jgi:hypothetical protein